MNSIETYLSDSSFRLSFDIRPASHWHRPFCAQDLPSLNLSAPLTSSGLTSQRLLAIHRILFSVYEQSMLSLPQRQLDVKDLSAFNAFYAPELVAIGGALRPGLEHAAGQLKRTISELLERETWTSYEASLRAVGCGHEYVCDGERRKESGNEAFAFC